MNNVTTFTIKPIAPFRLDLTAWVLKRRPSNDVDRWDGQTYRRTLWLNDELVEMIVTQVGSSDNPKLEVIIVGAKVTDEMKAPATAALQRLLGTQINLEPFYQFVSQDARLGPLAERFRGFKPTRFLTPFESVANAIACQQLSLSLGIILLNRVAEHFGAAHEGSTGITYAFPQPKDLVRRQPLTFRKLGFSLQKGRSLIELARACQTGALDVEVLDPLDNAAVTERLLALRGVGRWTAEYVLLRGMARLNVFPGDDVGARNNLCRWLNLETPLDYDGVRRILAPWEPYTGLIFFHLLLDNLAMTGKITP